MQIKAKQGYNVIINDIDVSLLSGKDFIEISDELLNSSADFKKLSHLIEIKGKKTAVKKTESVKQKTNVNVVQTENNMTTIDMNTETKKSDMVVFTPDLLKDNKTVKEQPIKQEQVKNTSAKEQTPKKDVVKEAVKEEPIKKEIVKETVKEEVKVEASTVTDTKVDNVKSVEETKKVNSEVKTDTDKKVDVKAKDEDKKDDKGSKKKK